MGGAVVQFEISKFAWPHDLNHFYHARLEYVDVLMYFSETGTFGKVDC